MTGAYAGVIFDIDDTLYQVSQLLQLQWLKNSERLKDRGIDALKLCKAYSELESDLSYRELLPQALMSIGSDPHWGYFLRDIAEEAVPREIKAYPGVENLFMALKRHDIKIGVLSNGKPGRQLEKMEVLGLSEHCDSFLVCDGVNLGFKPEAETFRHAAQMLGLEPHEICMVGDRSDNDIIPALKLGMGALRLELGNHKAQERPEGVTLNTKCPQTAWAWLLDNVSSRRRVSIPAQRHAFEDAKISALR